MWPIATVVAVCSLFLLGMTIIPVKMAEPTEMPAGHR